MQPTKLSKIGQKLFRVIEFDKNEQLICEIRKHTFGLAVIYITGILISVILFTACLVGSWFYTTELSDTVPTTHDVSGWAIVIGLALALLSLGATAIAGHIYNSNVMLVTNEKIAQVLYTSLFSRKISQLSIGDVQDVTVTQKTVFSRLFNFGTIVVETAGEQQNYTFTYAPNPYHFAKKMVSAHELNLEKFGN